MNESDFEGVCVDPEMLSAILKLTQGLPLPEDLVIRACEIRREAREQSLTSYDGNRTYDFDMSDLNPSDIDLLGQITRCDLIQASQAFLNACYLNVGIGGDPVSRLTFWDEREDDSSSTLMLEDYEIKFLEIVFPIEFNAVV